MSKRTVRNRHLEKHKSKASYIFTNIAEAVLIGIIVALLVYFIAMVNFTPSSADASKKSNSNKSYRIDLNINNTVNMRGSYNWTSVTAAQLALSELSNIRGQKTYPIYLVIDSPGGDIGAGMALIDYANSLGNIHTITIEAMSMGALTAQLVAGQRYVTQNSVMMFHRAALGGLSGQVNEGEIESRLKFLKEMITDITQRVADRLGISYDDLQKKQKDEYWIYGRSIVEHGAADYVVSIKCSKKLIEKMEVVDDQYMVFKVQLTFSACPLFRSPIK
jgi:ATP-dependent protease ClpP protease subunit